VELILVHRRTHFFQLCTALLFFFCGAGVMCAAQSTGSAKADSASRATVTYQQGMSALQKGDLSSARTAFEKVVRLAPQSPEGHNSLGWVLLAQGEVDAAIAHFRTAVKLNPDFAQPHMNLANAFAAKRDLHGALRESQEATRLAPNDSETHHTLGRILNF
jgi:Flp pilus assembly protein TadD